MENKSTLENLRCQVKIPSSLQQIYKDNFVIAAYFTTLSTPPITPKGPRPFFCEKILKTAISIAMSKKF